MIVYKVSDKFKKAARILSDWNFIYEELPSGNLRAEPMDFRFNPKLEKALQKAGYFVLEGRDFYIVKAVQNAQI